MAKVTSREIAAAERKLEAARAAVVKLRDRHAAKVTLPRMRKRIGECFKYRNSYSCPRDESEKWWLYARIVSVADLSEHFEMVTAQRDQYGRIQIEVTSVPASGDDAAPMSGYEPIDGAEFAKAVRPMLADLRRMLAVER